MKEVDHQTRIKNSVKQQGGYSFKLSNRFTIGIPDLLIMLHPFAPCLAEVKDLKEVVDNFDLQLGVTPKQNHEMKMMNQIYWDWGHRVAFLLIVLKWRNMDIIVPLPQGTERLAASSLVEGSTFWKRIPGRDGGEPTYPIEPLLTTQGVPKV